jgi:hypothetical protein
MLNAFPAAGMLVALLLGPPGVPAGSYSGSTDPVALGRVVLLPFLDNTQAPTSAARPADASRQPSDSEISREAALSLVEAECRMRGIEYVRRAELAAALAPLKLALAREEERTPARLKALASSLKANYVVTGIIQQARADWRRRGLLGEATAEARVQVRVFDVRAGRYVDGIELTATADARSKTTPSKSALRTQRVRAQSVRDATRKALEAWAKPYPLLYEEDPGEEFVVYPSRPETSTSAATTPKPSDTSGASLPTNPVLFKLAGGQQVQGKIEKYEYGIYTVMTEQGRVFIAREHVLGMTPR